MRLPDIPDKRLTGPPARSGWLLVILTATYLLSAFVSAWWIAVLQVFLFLGAAALALRISRLPPRVVRLAMLSIIVLSAIGVTGSFTGSIGIGIASLLKSLVLFIVVVSIIHRIFIADSITMQSVYAALSAYLVIGFMFAAIFAAIYHFGTTDFFSNHQPANTNTFQYFSFTTLTTLGYGDFTAVGSGGRAVAMVEAFTGPVFLVTLVAYLVTAASPAAAGDGRP